MDGTIVKCQHCGFAPLPARERLRTVLDGAVDQLNAAKVGDALRGSVPDDTVASLAGMAHAMLYAISMLERCEACIAVELERAAALIVGDRLAKERG